MEVEVSLTNILEGFSTLCRDDQVSLIKDFVSILDDWDQIRDIKKFVDEMLEGIPDAT